MQTTTLDWKIHISFDVTIFQRQLYSGILRG